MATIQETTKHTATPWEIVRVHGIPIGVGTRVNSVGKECRVFTLIGNTMDETDDQPDCETLEANAQHIVRCVNSHDDLVAKLTKIRNWFNQQAKRDEDKAETERFLTLRDAYKADARNYRAMAADADESIQKATGAP